MKEPFYQTFSWYEIREDVALTSFIFSTIVPCPLSMQNSRTILLKEYKRGFVKLTSFWMHFILNITTHKAITIFYGNRFFTKRLLLFRKF